MSHEKTPPARIAVAGAGLIGARHAHILAEEGMLAAIADPAAKPSACHGVPLYADLASLIAAQRVDGIVIATPNQRHEKDGMTAICAGIPVLMEKPLAEDAEAAARLVEAGQRAGVPLLVGHHRRYNPLVEAAKAEIISGRLGRIVSAQATCWLSKPNSYFDTPWRREEGAGPVLINLIHDIELLIHLCGDVTDVLAATSSAVRGFAVEDTGAAILRFESGTLGTLAISDTITSPWSWELTAGENPAYPKTDAFAYSIGGEKAALTLPDLTVWENKGPTGWHQAIHQRKIPFPAADPLLRQLRHFADVAQGRAKPAVTGEDGLMAMRVIDAIRKAANTGRSAPVEPRPQCR